MEDHEILAGLVDSTMPLLADERLGRLNVRERPIMHRIAVNLARYFPQWDVDTEYNRHGDTVKRLQRSGGSYKNIEPDILVHMMGERLTNLMAIELKLADNDQFEDDIMKLEGLTHPDQGYVYSVGVFLQLDFRRPAVVRCTVFKGGSANDDLTTFLRNGFETALDAIEKGTQGPS